MVVGGGSVGGHILSKGKTANALVSWGCTTNRHSQRRRLRHHATRERALRPRPVARTASLGNQVGKVAEARTRGGGRHCGRRRR